MSSLRQAWRIGILTFFLSVLISTLSRLWISSVLFWLSIFPLIIIIAVGIVFDMIGTASTAASETPFHAMAADKVHGARRSIGLIRNADRVATFCNDVVGEICGTISGALTAALTLNVTLQFHLHWNKSLLEIIFLGFVAAFSVSGKAVAKRTAIRRADWIIFRVGKLLAAWDRFIGKGNNKRKKLSRGKLKKPVRKREN